MGQIFPIFRSALSRFQSYFAAPRTAQGQIIHALDETLRQRRATHADAILLIAEIDDFDMLQSQLKLAELELCLQSLERRLKGGLLARDKVHRLDGGRFGCVLSPMHGYCAEDVLIVAGQIQDLIAVPVVMRDTSAKVSVSIGCAMAKMATLTTGEMMFEAARLALVEAAGKGPAGLQFYADPMGEQLSLRRALHKDATAALHSGAIHAHFQPQIDLATGEISGFEALARWAHHDRGPISPFEFLPVLEESGMMHPLGRVMLQDALKALVKWDAQGLHVPRAPSICAQRSFDTVTLSKKCLFN
ncbi:MAG: EAL domain-containing protein [Pseudomonadota bacterium]